MTTHCETLAAAAARAALAGIGISPASMKPLRRADFEIDRELSLAVSDGFTRQTWRQAGRVWSETRDVLSMHEDEHLRIYVTNDMPGVRVISFGENGPVQRIRPGETVALDLAIDRLDDFTIAVVGQPALSRPVRVRANAGARLNVA